AIERRWRREVHHADALTNPGRRFWAQTRPVDPGAPFGRHDAAGDDVEQRPPLVAPVCEDRRQPSTLEPRAETAQTPVATIPHPDAQQIDHGPIIRYERYDFMTGRVMVPATSPWSVEWPRAAHRRTRTTGPPVLT